DPSAVSAGSRLCGTSGEKARFGSCAAPLRNLPTEICRNRLLRAIACCRCGGGPDIGRATVGPASSRAPSGDVAEWLRSGLQNRLRRFNSGRRLHSLDSPTAALAPPPLGRAGRLHLLRGGPFLEQFFVPCSVVLLLCGKSRYFHCYTSIY